MGSLKDEMRGLHEDLQPCERKQDRERPGSSDGGDVPEGPRLNAGQESANQSGDREKINAGDAEEGSAEAKDRVLYYDTDQLDSARANGAQADALPPAKQPRADETAAAEQKDAADRDEVPTVRKENPSDGDADPDESCEEEKEHALVPAPSASDPSDPNSPAPFGQHHMRTQVSLEVVQCCSAATSPMTPPEGAHSFFFPASFGRPGAAGTDAKDAELQVGRQVQFCSVATSPMTPKTPSASAFPELSGRETAQRKSPGGEGQGDSGRKESSPAPTQVLGAESSPESLTDRPAQVDSQVTLEDGDCQRKQQRMGSMDQDITILVTHYGNTEEDEEEEAAESTYRPAEAEAEEGADDGGALGKVPAERAERDRARDGSSRDAETDAKPANSEAEENQADDGEDFAPTKSTVPESPAPFGCHNIRTQVSLEVVQCQSVATSPMTPPGNDNAFCFPNSADTYRDAELQVGRQVEFRSVATAPMTPRTPTAAAFPDFRKEVSVEEKIVEVEEQVSTPSSEEEEKNVTGEEERAEAAEGGKEEGRNRKEDEDKCEEPVQEVSWDEKGMTWEVYGAVVEVAVLGSAIQKHLEKQVKKQKSQSSLPPPPPLNPSATPLVSEHPQGGSGSGKGRGGKRGERGAKVSRGRRNPFRQLMENMQQPHCCSKAHTTE